MTSTMTVSVVRNPSPGTRGVTELDLSWKGEEYSTRRWSDSGRYPFALLVGGRVYLHNAVVEALYLAGGAEVRYGAGRCAARYEAVSEDTLLSLATRPCWENRTERERQKDAGTRAAFAALVEAL